MMSGSSRQIVVVWTGAHARCLRNALRMSVRTFARHLGVAVRTVSYWESAGRGIRPRPEMQAALDRVHESASDEVRSRFAIMCREVASGVDRDADGVALPAPR